MDSEKTLHVDKGKQHRELKKEYWHLRNNLKDPYEKGNEIHSRYGISGTCLKLSVHSLLLQIIPAFPQEENGKFPLTI